VSVEWPGGQDTPYTLRKRAEFPPGKIAMYRRTGSPRDGQSVVVLDQGNWVREAVNVRFADGTVMLVGWEDLGGEIVA